MWGGCWPCRAGFGVGGGISACLHSQRSALHLFHLGSSWLCCFDVSAWRNAHGQVGYQWKVRFTKALEDSCKIFFPCT